MSFSGKGKPLSSDSLEELQAILKALAEPKRPETKKEKADFLKRKKALAAKARSAAEEYRLNAFKKYRCEGCFETYLRNRSNFFKDSSQNDGLSKLCIQCEKKKREEYLNRPGVRERQRLKDKLNYQNKGGKEKARKYSAAYYQRAENRIIRNLRTRLKVIVYSRSKGFRNGSTKAFIGCTRRVLFEHIESLWPKDGGMTWENYGKRSGNSGWHIDHIIPYAYFKEEFASGDLGRIKRASALVNHYTNLCPLWGVENLEKSGTLPKWVSYNGRRMNSNLHLKVYGKSYSIEGDNIDI